MRMIARLDFIRHAVTKAAEDLSEEDAQEPSDAIIGEGIHGMLIWCRIDGDNAQSFRHRHCILNYSSLKSPY